MGDCVFLVKEKGFCSLTQRHTHMATDTTATTALSHKFNYRVAVAASSQRKTMTIKVISLTCTAGSQANPTTHAAACMKHHSLLLLLLLFSYYDCCFCLVFSISLQLKLFTKVKMVLKIINNIFFRYLF